jgi:peptide/nickel transport system substrate-binding protein
MPLDIARRTVIGGLATLGAVAALPRIARSQSAPGDRLVVATQGSPRTLEPLRDFSNVLFRVGYNVFEGLLRVDYKDGLTIAPSLATAWRRVSPTVLELTLREGVRFHDGVVMTADDVAFSFGASAC